MCIRSDTEIDLFSKLSRLSTPPSGSSSNGSGVLPGGWTEKRLNKWCDYLQPNVAEVVRYVSAHAPEISYDDVAVHLGALIGAAGAVDGNCSAGR